jgi:hypothetical protein
MASFPKETSCGLQDYHATPKGPKEIRMAARTGIFFTASAAGDKIK